MTTYRQTKPPPITTPTTIITGKTIVTVGHRLVTTATTGSIWAVQFRRTGGETTPLPRDEAVVRFPEKPVPRTLQEEATPPHITPPDVGTHLPEETTVLSTLPDEATPPYLDEIETIRREEVIPLHITRPFLTEDILRLLEEATPPHQDETTPQATREDTPLLQGGANPISRSVGFTNRVITGLVLIVIGVAAQEGTRLLTLPLLLPSLPRTGPLVGHVVP